MSRGDLLASPPAVDRDLDPVFRAHEGGKVAVVVGYAESTTKREKAVALDVMTERFFSPKVDTI